MSDFIPSQPYHDDEASDFSEDSEEPYYDIQTGRIVPARDAWGILAAEGHPRYKHLASSSASSSRGDGKTRDAITPASSATVDSVFRTAAMATGTTATSDGDIADDTDDIRIVSSYSSGGGPTQLSIDRALHPHLNDSLSPSNHGPKKDTHPPIKAADIHDDDEETDPIIIRAKAMALAAQNGQKLTPEQLQLIAQPDVQQQKLIEEAKRIAKNNSRHGGTTSNSTYGGYNSSGIINLQQSKQELQQLGKDIKNFLLTEQGKPPSQWTADLGKFFEEQSLKKSTINKGNEAVEIDEVSTTSASDGGGKGGGETPKRKKMEGFGTDPNAQPQRSPQQRSSFLGGEDNSFGGGKWPNLPLLNKIYGNDVDNESSEQQHLQVVRISGVLWKRRSGFGKHSTNAWEKRRVELRGSKLIYYSTVEEIKEVDENNKKEPGEKDGPVGEREGGGGGVTPRTVSNGSEGSATREEDAFHTLKKGIEQAAQAAEQQLQTAKDGLSRFAAAAGIDKLKSSAVPSVDTPRGILDLCKERATASASMGHTGAPTPFCLSIKVKSLTQWKFAFDSHSMMMEWLAALTDVVVEASLEAAEKSTERHWELDNYCISRKDSQESSKKDTVAGAVYREGSGTTLETYSPSQTCLDSNVGSITDTHWTLAGNNLIVACVVANMALLLARSSSTSIAQFWKLFVFTNFGIWQLCTRPKMPSLPCQNKSVEVTTKPHESTPKSVKPTAGATTIKVSSIVNPNEIDMPSWLPISSSIMEVRSHGYLVTKKKVPCPGELYECIAVDCFASNARIHDIAARVKLPDIKFDDRDLPKTWQSPDIFIASLAIPTEAPKFGQGSDDGPGITIVGYFKMKEETRSILRRISAPGYNSSSDEAESEVNVQKRIVNGVRLWEQYCKQAPSDPSFQARFKLIPSANLEELGCPVYIAKYNGKPVLIKRNQVTGFLTNYPSLNVMSFEISFHPFPYLFKQAMAYLKDYFDNTIGSFGFVIEGRNDDELPEVMIGAMKVCYPGPSLICSVEDFFSDNCPPKSSASKKME